MRRTTWTTEWGQFIARDEYGEIGRVVGVPDGWDAQTRRTALGVYLTAEMARGAVMGMRTIEIHGSYYYAPTGG